LLNAEKLSCCPCSTVFAAINYFTLVEGELNELKDMFVFDGGGCLMSAEFKVLETGGYIAYGEYLVLYTVNSFLS